MAFCPLCGKKLPDNGICSCGRRLDENGNIVSEVQEAVETNSQALQQAAQPVQQEVQPVQQQAQPVQQDLQQVQEVAQSLTSNVETAVPKAPAGPSIFGEAFKMFVTVFKNPAGANEAALEGKLPVGSALVLGGLYFLIVWISMMLLLVGKGGHLKFLPAFGFGALAGVFFCGMRCGAALLISLFSKNPQAKFMKVFSALCVDTLLLDCILVLMMLFQFATMHFAVFFMLIYVGLVLYQNTELLRKLSDNSRISSNKKFWFNFIMIVAYAFLIMIAYIIYCNIPTSASKYYSSIFDW